MSRDNQTSHGAPKDGTRLAVYAAAGAAALLFVGALALWQAHGLGIYMDRLASGIANCF